MLSAPISESRDPDSQRGSGTEIIAFARARRPSFGISSCPLLQEGWLMEFRFRRSFQVLAPGSSLRRRVAYSLVIVRLILVPVIFLAVYYLLQIGWIVDRIVSFDAPAATFAQQATIEMLDARRAERNYLLAYDPSSLQANRDALDKIEKILISIRSLNSDDEGLTQQAVDALPRYCAR